VTRKCLLRLGTNSNLEVTSELRLSNQQNQLAIVLLDIVECRIAFNVKNYIYWTRLMGAVSLL